MLRLSSIIDSVENKLNRAVSAANIVEELENKVISEETLIPSDVPILIEKKNYRVNGEVWVVHKNDIDPFPSSPHAHNYDQNLVMHLGNGRMYRQRNYVATAKRKQFLALRQKIDNVDLPPLEI